ncbi:MAG: hypothetical protein WCJ30_00445 [Deltaproteobacteria bacterium]
MRRSVATVTVLAAALFATTLAAQPARPPRVRELRPLAPGSDYCTEMYSSCSREPNGSERCTSAPFMIACGQTRPSPHRGDNSQLRCVCP